MKMIDTVEKTMAIGSQFTLQLVISHKYIHVGGILSRCCMQTIIGFNSDKITAILD